MKLNLLECANVSKNSSKAKSSPILIVGITVPSPSVVVGKSPPVVVTASKRRSSIGGFKTTTSGSLKQTKDK